MMRLTFGKSLPVSFVLTVMATISAQAEGALPSLLANYEIARAGGVSEHLHVLRTESRIEHRLGGELIEVWQRDERGEISHFKIFPKARRVVHYTAGDLRTLHVEPDWEELGALVGSGSPNQLRRIGVSRLGGRSVDRRVGSLRAEPASLRWLSRDALPAQLVIGRGAAKRTLKLLSFVPCNPGTCVPTIIDGYRAMDFADLGDAEHDPFVRRFVAAFGIGHGHSG